jgi:putative phage-type endonuclease
MAIIDREQWLAERRKGIGASDAPTVVGVRKDPSRFRLWCEKRGEIEPEPPNDAMRMGLAAESAIASMYTERTGWGFTRQQIHVTHPMYPWMKATIDGELDQQDYVEFKLAGAWMTRTLPEDGSPIGLPDAWVIQAQHQMAVTGAKHIQFAVWCADPSFRIYYVHRDEDLINQMTVLESEFWLHVVNGTPPAEFGPADLGAIAKHFNRDDEPAIELNALKYAQIVRAYKEAAKTIKEEEDDRDHYKAELLMAMGNASAAKCGSYTLKRKVVHVKERTQTIKASQYVRFTVSNGDSENE